MTGTKLSALPRDAFSNLRALRILDLRNNALEEINVTTLDVPTLKHLHLAGKKQSDSVETFAKSLRAEPQNVFLSNANFLAINWP